MSFSIFGDQKLFAIEIYRKENVTPYFIEGHGTCWCRGEKISREKNEIYLIDIYTELQGMRNKDRSDKKFYQMNVNDAFQKLNRTIYTDEDWFDKYNKEAEKEDWFRFDINIITFNLQYKLFMIDGDYDSRLMIGEDDPKKIADEIYLPKGYFNKLIDNVCIQIEDWSK